MPMTIETGEESLRLIANENLILSTAMTLQKEMLEELESFKGHNVILDLTKVEQVDSIGLKLIIGLYKSCTEKSLSFHIETSSPTVLKLLKICNINKVINIKEV